MAPIRSQSSRRGTYVKRRRSTRRRGPSLAQRTYRRKGPSAQARQIRHVSRVANRNARVLRSQRCTLDYEYKGKSTTGWITDTWQVFDLTSPLDWTPTLRQNEEGNAAQSAYVSGMNLQWICSLNTLTRSSAITMFIVSIKSNATSFDPTAPAMIEGQTYQNGGPLASARLNSNIFKVHWSKSFMVMSNGLSGVSVNQSADEAVGDPETTFVRGNMNIRLGINYKSKATVINTTTPPKAWSRMVSKDILPSQRRWLMFYQQSGDPTNAPAFYWNALYTATTD